MENATKALIIAAAVLISIVLVALGVLLISNVSDPSEQANKVGTAIGDATGSAAGDAIAGIKGEQNNGSVTVDEFNAFRDTMTKNEKYNVSPWDCIAIVNDKIATLQEGKTITFKGYLYKGDADGDLRSKVSTNVGENLDSLIGFTTPNNVSSVQSELQTTKITEIKNYAKLYTVNPTNQKTLWRYGYDKDGYINHVEYILGIDLY